MKLLKGLGVLVGVAGLGIFTADAQDRSDALPRARELTVLAGRGAEIGVSVRDLAPADTAAHEAGGVMLEDVRPDSPAAKAGLKRSDIIVEFDGEHVRSARQFSRLIQEAAPGRSVTATIVRDGKRSEVKITPSENRQTFSLNGGQLGDRMRERWGDLGTFADRMPALDFDFDLPSMASRSRLGITVHTLSSQLADYFGAKDGVLVTSVADGSAAARAGIRAGDVIASINGEAVQSSEDLMRSLRDAHDHVTLGLVRDKKEMTMSVEVGSTRGR
jgi:serine protease Do